MPTDGQTTERSSLPECDMIMKGGITSGVVYPGAITELAKSYQFRWLGGASAGAIAAAVAAAAEYGSRNGGGGFDRLGELPGDLGTNMLARLQPYRPLRRQWQFVLGEIEAGASVRRESAEPGFLNSLGRVGRVLRFLLGDWRAILAFVLGTAVLLLLGLTQGGWAWVAGALIWLLLMVVGLVLAAKAVVTSTLGHLDDNNFGFCDGHSRANDDAVLPVTDWLNAELSGIAGLGDEVLTYAHLWGPEATEAYREAAKDSEQIQPPAPDIVGARQLDAIMMVTNLGQGRAHKFPFDVRTFMWCESCLSNYFDAATIDQMTATGPEIPADEDQFDPTCPRHPERRLRELPLAPDMPVIVGVRISFSFPLMFSAVPLHIADYTRAAGQRGAKICWFADGGIASNFPMHFFDALVPGRPTFGISLSPLHPDYPETLVHRPSYQNGWLLRVSEINSVVGSLRAILTTMQNWQDRSLQTVPGYRDRVADVRLRDSEGGLNLTMPADVIEELSARGETAARTFEDFSIDGHRWIRYRSSLSQMADDLTAFEQSWNDPDVVGTPIRQIVDGDENPKPKPLSKRARTAMSELTEDLLGWPARWRDGGEPGEADVPRPKPDRKTGPRL